MGLDSLYDFISRGDSLSLQRFLTHSPPPLSLLDSPDLHTGWTPLSRAVICGHYNVARALLRHGVNPDKKTAAGESPLHIAVDASQYLLCRVLLEYNADPNQRNDYGETPLHLAVSRNDSSLVSLLLSHNADPHLKDFIVRDYSVLPVIGSPCTYRSTQSSPDTLYGCHGENYSYGQGVLLCIRGVVQEIDRNLGQYKVEKHVWRSR